jgi:hypothetical protein
MCLVPLVFCALPPSDDDANRCWTCDDCARALPPQNNNNNNTATVIENINDGIRLSLLPLISCLEKKSAREVRVRFFFFFLL